MTLIHELDLDVLMTCLHTKNEVSMSRLSKVKSPNRKDKHTNRHDVWWIYCTFIVSKQLYSRSRL